MPSAAERESLARDLLSHHGGVPNGAQMVKLWRRELPSNLEEVVRKRVKVTRKPGEAFQYSNYGFARLRLPIAATKLVCRRQVPLQRLRRVFGDLKMTAQFERHHRIIGFFIEQQQLPGRVSAAARTPYPGRNLFPIRHKGAGCTCSPPGICQRAVQPAKNFVTAL